MVLRGMREHAYPAVLLGLPLGRVHVHLGAAGAVGELEEAGEHAVVLGRVREDGVLEVDAVGDDAVVLIHPKKRKDSRFGFTNNKKA